jgi:outer membrane protein OmpA-like peptidoglycan-associated protein
MKTFMTIGILGSLGLVAGCSSALPPNELVNARAAYARASTGTTAQLDPADLHVAKETLDRAERSFAADGPSQKTKDAAYTAERRVEIAEAHARTLAAVREKEHVIAQAQAAQAAALKSTNAQLGRTKEQLDAERQAFAAEQQRRMEAEKRAKQAAADLARIASVKQEPRGMVITLSGAVLFATGKSELLPTAQAKLGEVARALTQQDKDSKIVVEGHTDSQGSDAMNEELSQKRAASVRDYLVAHGMAADRITAKGMGETQPIADNSSPEGRANNRRVEIVVQPSTTGPSSTNPQ